MNNNILILLIINISSCNKCVYKNSGQENDEYIGVHNYYVEYEDFDKYYVNSTMVDVNNFYVLQKMNTNVEYYFNAINVTMIEPIVPPPLHNYDSYKGDVQPLSALISYKKEDDIYSKNTISNEERINEIRKEFLYWFYDNDPVNGNNSDYVNKMDEIAKIRANFNFLMPFFGFRYNYIVITLNGYLEFSDSPEFTYEDFPLEFPNKLWPKQNDPSFIAIFYSKCRIGKIYTTDHDQRSPGLYYRLATNLKRTKNRLDMDIRDRVQLDIREGIVGAAHFIPKHVVIVTWKNVSFGGGTDKSLFITNTFQIILATDEYYTYAIFNYATIDWTSHIDAGGDVETGLGGFPAFVGFNAGNGYESFEYNPYSQSEILRELANTGYTNHFQGRHIFRIDEKIICGSCRSNVDPSHFPLVFAPESGNMLGGSAVNITGPCFQSNSRVLCHFGNVTVPGYIIDRTRIVCIQPFLPTESYISFDISLENEDKRWHGIYFVETPDAENGDVKVDRNIFSIQPKELNLYWNNVTYLSKRLKLTLWGYRETEDYIPEFMYIDDIAPNIFNSGYLKITVHNLFKFIYRNNYKTNDMEFGFLQIAEVVPGNRTTTSFQVPLWSKAVPLAWYFRPQWKRVYSNSWIKHFCRKWIDSDRLLSNFIDKLPPCPCTLQQALNDKGQYIPDYVCNKDTNSCLNYLGIAHCVRSAQLTVQGSEIQCCYNGEGNLELNTDNLWATRPRRIGKSLLSTWYNEIRPFYMCCVWQTKNSEHCKIYIKELRPSKDCKNYKAPDVGAIFGSLHYITFDNYHYTFNGMGEFLVARGNASKDDLFEIQGRFQKIIKQDKRLLTTHLTSLLVKGSTSTIIEVNLRPKNAQWHYHLDIIVDGRKTYFDKPKLKLQTFNGVIVYRPSYITNHSEFIIILSCGVGIEVIETAGFMAVRIYVPNKFMGNISGLLGNFNEDMTDEFVLPDGQHYNVSELNNFELIHKSFGLQWMLSDAITPYLNRALFQRKYCRTSSFYSDKSLIPNFIKEPDDFLTIKSAAVLERAKSMCGDSYQCRYDYGSNKFIEVAKFTRKFFDDTMALKKLFRDGHIKCGILEPPEHGKKLNIDYSVGSRVHFECLEGYTMIGDSDKICTVNGTWSDIYLGVTICIKNDMLDEHVGNLPGLTEFVNAKNSANLLRAMVLMIVTSFYLIL